MVISELSNQLLNKTSNHPFMWN